MWHGAGPRGGTFDGALRAGPSVVGCAIWEAQVRFFGWGDPAPCNPKEIGGRPGLHFFLDFLCEPPYI